LVLRATFLAAVCNFVVPVGYMPAAFADGGPFRLCPSGWPAGVMPGHDAHGDMAGHADGGEHAGGDHDAWEHCAYGAASSSPALVGADHTLGLARVSDVPIDRPGSVQIRGRTLPAFRSRAPPATTPSLR
jgi:hypothetical protein